MITLVYYISDYGYGHATRSVAIIRKLLKSSMNIRVVICHSYALDFIKDSLKGEVNVEFHEVKTDIGFTLLALSNEEEFGYDNRIPFGFIAREIDSRIVKDLKKL